MGVDASSETSSVASLYVLFRAYLISCLLVFMLSDQYCPQRGTDGRALCKDTMLCMS